MAPHNSSTLFENSFPGSSLLNTAGGWLQPSHLGSLGSVASVGVGATAIAFLLSFVNVLKTNNNNTGRTKRQDSVSTGIMGSDENNYLLPMVMAAVDSQACMQRALCEVGVIARKQKIVTPLLKATSGLVTEKVSPYYKILLAAIENTDVNCEAYSCAAVPFMKQTSSSTMSNEL